MGLVAYSSNATFPNVVVNRLPRRKQDRCLLKQRPYNPLTHKAKN